MTKLKVLEKIREDIFERILRWEIDLDVNREKQLKTTNNIELQGLYTKINECEGTIKQLNETLRMCDKKILKEKKVIRN